MVIEVSSMPSKRLSLGISLVVIVLAGIVLVNSVGNLQQIDKQQKILDDKLKSLQVINSTMNNGTITPSQASTILAKLEQGNANSSSIMSEIQTIKAQDSLQSNFVQEKKDMRCVNGPVDGFVPVGNNGTGYWADIFRELPQSECDRNTSGMLYLRPFITDILRAHADEDEYGKIYYTEYRLLNGTVLAFGEKEIKQSTS